MSISQQRFVAVIGIDFSQLSNRALDEAIAWAGLRCGEVHVVYVHQDLPLEALFGDKLTDAVSLDSALEQVRQRAEERVKEVTSRPGIAAPARVVAHVRRGSPAEEIAQLAADLDADLVMVGSHGRHGVERIVLGSVAERVSHLARCPVWIVRPKSHVGGVHVPQIEPPCPDCIAKRDATQGAEQWCAHHSEHHLRTHHYAYVSGSVYAANTTPYGATPAT